MNTEIQQSIQLENLRTPRINHLYQYIRDVYQDIVDRENIEFDYDLTTSKLTNKRIITKIIVGAQSGHHQFQQQAFGAQCAPAVQEIIDRRNRRDSRLKSKHDRRVLALRHYRTNSEEKYPSSGMDKFLEKQYQSEEESEDENAKEMPFKFFRPDYRSETANKFLKELDQLASLLKT
ncbi:hypothetical protein BDA99DRAFT_601228 [Phascolomyces articulosus]|uniref:Uncharacterized protein n=1 Tax=Phascolomyces articulosus TaxID=60185 RepID=A0AAD5K9F0_9FUNG|nr:hypothetical protein BDA99DRAFT_601228 [Phascolomyces articulosus]